MKVVVSGCWHLDLVVAGYDFHEDILKAARMVVDETQGADLFVYLGDLFDTPNPSPRAYATAIELFDQVGCPAVILKGNHDEAYGDREDALEPLRKVRFNEEFLFVGKPTYVRFGKRVFGFCNFLNDTKAKKAVGANSQELVDRFFEMASKDDVFDWEGKKIKKVHAIFTHLDIADVYGSSDSSAMIFGGALNMPMDVVKNLSCPVVAGHLHNQGKITPNVWLPGSIVPTTFNAEGKETGYFVMRV